MNNLPPFVPFLILALMCCLASVGIMFIAMLAASSARFTDTGMLAVAAMVAAPAVMGIGIAAYLPRDRN